MMNDCQKQCSLRSHMAWVALLMISSISLSIACVPYYFERDRPGDLDIEKPPPDPEVRERVVPDDPGVSFFTAQLAPVLDFGGSFGGLQGDSWPTLQLGLEMSAGSGTASRRFTGLSLLESFYYTSLSYTVNVGWLPYSTQDSISHQLYAEFRTRSFDFLHRFGIGWNLHPTTGSHGPQASMIFMDFLHLRINWQIDHGWALVAGYRFPISYAYVWSR